MGYVAMWNWYKGVIQNSVISVSPAFCIVNCYAIQIRGFLGT